MCDTIKHKGSNQTL